MLWHAVPPELNTARLMAGAGPSPMLQAAAGWESLAMSLQVAADDLAASLRSLGEAWTGEGSSTALAAATPMVAWLQTASGMAQARAAKAVAQAAAYTQALGTTPSLPEIAANHISTAVLTATNFFGINLVPIAFNETDYFVRMWTQAGTAMDVYQAQTMANTLFEKLEPMASILVPTVGDAVSSEVFSNLSDFAAAAATLAGALPLGQAMSSISHTTAQMQSLTSPLMSSTSRPLTGSSVDASDSATPQLGLLGASPLSNHPLTGGTGPSMGTGLLRAEALPGAGGTPTRTPLMSQFLDKTTLASGVAAGTSVMGGAAPLGMAGHSAQAGSARPAMAMPAPMAADSPDEYMPDEQDDDW